MLLARLKEQVVDLSVTEQRALIAFLVARQPEHDEEYLRSLDRKIDDPDPARWVDLDDLNQRLAPPPR